MKYGKAILSRTVCVCCRLSFSLLVFSYKPFSIVFIFSFLFGSIFFFPYKYYEKREKERKKEFAWILSSFFIYVSVQVCGELDFLFSFNLLQLFKDAALWLILIFQSRSSHIPDFVFCYSSSCSIGFRQEKGKKQKLG